MSSVGVFDEVKGVGMMAVMEPVASKAKTTKARTTPDILAELRSKYFFFYLSIVGKASSLIDSSEGELSGIDTISLSFSFLLSPSFISK